MKIIFGLGNPGKEYKKTRHNIGFELLDYLDNDFDRNAKSKFNGFYNEMVINNEKILLVKPQTYMNNSGETIKKYIQFYKLSPDDILIIQDDMDMELGKIKIVYDSSSGGHNGIKSIENLLNTTKYLRLKIGISKNNSDVIDYVLGSLSKKEEEIIKNSYSKLKDIIGDFVDMNKLELMNKYNGKNK